MIVLAVCLSVLLVSLAALYGFWAAGRFWPYRTEAELPRRIVRRDHSERMPHRGFLATVAVFLAAAAVWPWLLLYPPSVGRWTFVFPWAAIVLVLGRAEFSPSPDSPFMRRDRRYYGPLAPIAATGFAILVWEHDA